MSADRRSERTRQATPMVRSRGSTDGVTAWLLTALRFIARFRFYRLTRPGASHVRQRLAQRDHRRGGELIESGTRQTCLSQFCHLDATYTNKPLSQRYHGSRTGRTSGGISMCAPFRLGQPSRCDPGREGLDGWEAFLQVAPNGFEPASGKGFARAHATLGAERVAGKNIMPITARLGMV
jgi:hypothetical protein